MTNKDRYKQAFGALHASETFTLEDKPMMRRRDNKKFYLPKQVIAACLTVVVFLGSFSVVYAMNLGGIRKTIQLWIHGDAKDAEITFDGEGSYSLTYTDESGKTQERSGGGVAMDGLGQERPLTPEELIDELDSPETLVKEDGSIWLYYLDQKINITDRFDDEGFCFVELSEKGHPLYVTVRKDGALAASSDGYIQPDDF